jgi:hypothetical protein
MHVCAHTLTFMRTYFNACTYMHVCMYTHVYAYILKRVHLCTRAQVGMLTGAVTGLVAGRMQLGRDSQQSSACLLFLTSLPGFPLHTFCQHDQHALTVHTFFSPWARMNEALTVVTRGVGVGSVLGAALSAASFTAEGRCVYIAVYLCKSFGRCV